SKGSVPVAAVVGVPVGIHRIRVGTRVTLAVRGGNRVPGFVVFAVLIGRGRGARRGRARPLVAGVRRGRRGIRVPGIALLAPAAWRRAGIARVRAVRITDARVTGLWTRM